MTVVLVLLAVSGAQDHEVGTLPPGPRGGPVEVVHALFVQAQMIEDGQVMFCFPRGEDVPSLIVRVDGQQVRAVGADRMPLEIAILEKRLPGFTGVVVVQAEFELPDEFFLKVLHDRSVNFVLPRAMFAPMAMAAQTRRAPGETAP